MGFSDPNVITYNAGQLVQLLGDLTAQMNEFNQLNNEMGNLRNKFDAVWSVADSDAAQSFNLMHRRWTDDVEEIQGALAQIIRAASDGQGDMADTERAAARMFNG